MGPYAGVDKSTPRSAIHPHYKGKAVEWGRSLQLVEHICICLLIPKTTNRKRECLDLGIWWKKVREVTLYLSIDILWSMGNPMTELTLTPRRSWLYFP
jgi:hypothetical protein